MGDVLKDWGEGERLREEEGEEGDSLELRGDAVEDRGVPVETE